MATQQEQIRNCQERMQEATNFWQAAVAHIASGNHQASYTPQDVAGLLTHFNDVASGNKTAEEAKALHGIP